MYHTHRPLTAVLLVAGVGRRLGMAARSLPKCLVPLGDGTTLLGRAAEALAEAGVGRLVLATGHRSDLIERVAKTLPLPTRTCFNPEYASTQNAVSLWRCRDELRGSPFLKLNGDVLFETEVICRLLRRRASVSVAVDFGASLAEEEMKVRLEHGRIAAFGKWIEPSEAHGETMGIEWFSAAAGEALFEALGRAIAAGRTDLYYEDVYGDLIEAGFDFAAVDVSDLPWTEVDTPEDLAVARALAASGERHFESVAALSGIA